MKSGMSCGEKKGSLETLRHVKQRDENGRIEEKMRVELATHWWKL
jgi:hypothetical protein